MYSNIIKNLTLLHMIKRTTHHKKKGFRENSQKSNLRPEVSLRFRQEDMVKKALLLAAVCLLLVVQTALGQGFLYQRKEPQATHWQRLAERRIEDLRARLDEHHHQPPTTKTRRAGEQVNYQCTGCLKERDGSPKAVRFMVLEKLGVLFNPKARERAEKLGREYSCDKAALAVPECFDYKNWHHGWIGELMGSIAESLELNVTLLTRANFSEESAQNFKGASSFTRCVWEVKLGKVDACIGDFWETPERRSLVSFTAAIDSDQFVLATLGVQASDSFSPDSLLSIFAPFDRGLWAVQAAMIIVTALLIWFVEVTDGSPNNEDYG
jgi:hypothetical protein